MDAQTMMRRWEDQREIKNLMGRMSADYQIKKDGQMFAKYYCGRDDVSLGVNDGYYVGPAEVAGYYAARDARIRLETELIKRAFPQELEGLDPERLHGVGMLDCKPIDTAVVEVAGDGLTAKGLWSVRGSCSGLSGGGPVAWWVFAWFAGDFILENGQWRVWHLLYLEDVRARCGSDWLREPEPKRTHPEFEAAERFAMPAPTVAARLHSLYAADRPFSPSPAVPKPYGTFSDTFSYGWKKGESGED